MALLKVIWQKWQRLGKAIGHFQARVILSLFYFTFVLPPGLGVRLFADPLRLKPKGSSNWLERPSDTRDLASARRQS